MLKQVKILKGYSVHYVTQNGDVYLSKKNKIFCYSSLTSTIDHIITLPYNNKLLRVFNFNLMIRLFRSEIFHIFCTINNELVVFFEQQIFVINNGKILTKYQIPTYKRPLNVLYDSIKNHFIWGDYIDSKDRKEINIFQSKDGGRTWEIIYAFPKRAIKHIHNIIFDKYRKLYWILTGDNDSESGIWETGDFSKVEPFLIGAQKYRTVSIIVNKDGLIVPSDTEREKNYIRNYSFNQNKIQEIAELSGSCMYAEKINGLYFLSTMYEPSSLSNPKRSDLMLSEDGFNWKLLLSIKKDILPVKFFQYPIIKIPKYEAEYTGKFYYFSTRALKGGQNTLIYEASDGS